MLAAELPACFPMLVTVPFLCLQDGKIEAEVKLTGILSLGALQPGEVRKYGTTIAPGLYAPVHQHFFVARMDMAVDCRPGEPFNQVPLKLSYTLLKLGCLHLFLTVTIADSYCNHLLFAFMTTFIELNYSAYSCN